MARAPIGERRAETPRSFAENLEGILAKSLTPKNSATLFDEMLRDLIALVERATRVYQTQHPGETEIGSLLENKALASLGFDRDEVGITLSRISRMQSDMKTAMAEIDRRITAIETEPDVIVPPLTHTTPSHERADAGGEEGKIHERLRVLLYLLQREGVDVSNRERVALRQGEVTPLRREVSYTKVNVPEKNRIILVCDQTGNRTFVFDIDKLSRVLQGNRDVGDMKKNELEQLIHEHQGVGVSFIYSPHWTERLRGHLTNEIEALEEEEVSVLFEHVATGELDPWRGFWSDESDGTHWGGVRTITEKLNTVLVNPISRDVINARIKKAKPPLEKKRIHDLPGRLQDMYHYETVLSLVDDYATTPPIVFETEGLWVGFHIAPDGTHFASTQVIEDKLKSEGFDVPKGGVYTTVIDKSRTFKKIPVLPGGDTSLRVPHSAYCYEEVKPYFENRPPLITSGEWEGFFIGKNGHHYGSRALIARKLGISETGFKNRLKKHLASVSTEDIGRTNSDRAYSFEEVEPLLREFLALTPVIDSGLWKGFLEVRKGDEVKHHGSAMTISKRIHTKLKERGVSLPLGTLNGRVGRIIEEHATTLHSVPLRDGAGNEQEHAYAYEDIEKLYFEKNAVQ